MRLSLSSLQRCLIFSALFLLIGCSSNSWISSFVKYNGIFYSVTDEDIDEIGDKLGEVKYFLDKEGNAENFSSNTYPVGTEIYIINGINIEEAIAIKDSDGKYVKLISDKSIHN